MAGSLMKSMTLIICRPLAALTVFNPYGWLLVPWVLLACGFSGLTLLLGCLAALASTAWLNLFLPQFDLHHFPRHLLGFGSVLLLAILFYVLAMIPLALTLPVLVLIAGFSAFDLARREDWYHYNNPPQAW